MQLSRISFLYKFLQRVSRLFAEGFPEHEAWVTEKVNHLNPVYDKNDTDHETAM